MVTSGATSGFLTVTFPTTKHMVARVREPLACQICSQVQRQNKQLAVRVDSFHVF